MILYTTSSRIASVTILAFSLCGICRSQVSAFLSGTYGYQNNPLYNYLQTGDQVRSTYLEAEYSSAPFRARYVGGLTLFNSLTERNFLDHSLLLSLSSAPHALLAPAIIDTSGADSTDDARESETPPPDSLGMFGEVGLKVSSRHDRSVFREYDNAAGGLGGFLRWGMEGGWHLRLIPEAEYRVYPFTKELSNFTAMLTTEAGFGGPEGLLGGLRILTGTKHFTVAAFDSSRFESVRTYVTVTKPGSGKGGAKITVKQPSGKKVLANADVRTEGDLAGSAFFGYGWETGSLGAEMLYRHNLSPFARILARTPESATINQDIYNDFFSYRGPEATVTLRQKVPLSLQAVLSVGHMRKQFGAPAFDLEGTQIAEVRVDRRTEIEFTLSRYFLLSSAFGLDVALNGGIVRNESNDNYNDFSGWSLGISLGIGF